LPRRRQGIIAAVRSKNPASPTYVDRATGAVFPDPDAMVNAYLERFADRTGTPIKRLDERGYTFARRGSASVGLNVLEEHGVLLLLAPVMAVPEHGREAFYRRLLELSFLATAEVSFAIDAAKDQVYVRSFRRLDGLDYEEFADLLETMGRVTDEWDDVLKREFAGSPGNG
jgi:hypothetical protein